MSEECVFCEIVRGTEPASIVRQDELTMAFMDHRQFHAGHTLVIPASTGLISASSTSGPGLR
jgi:histidine triad (HIT) family protein